MSVNEWDDGEEVDMEEFASELDKSIVSYNICRLWSNGKKLEGIFLEENQCYRRLGNIKVLRDGFSLSKRNQTVGKSLCKSKRVVQVIFNTETSQLLNLRMFDGENQILRLIGKDGLINLDYLSLQ